MVHVPILVGPLHYSGIALKILRIFRCVEVEGRYWLAADMRLECYTSRWAGYAFYALLWGVLYVLGFPVVVFTLLYRKRSSLFGNTVDPVSKAVRSRYGFLYDAYGPSAWWWEVEELVRKLVLSAVVVLIEPGSPLQVELIDAFAMFWFRIYLICCKVRSALTLMLCVCMSWWVSHYPGDSGCPCLWLGARVAWHLQTMGQRQYDVCSPAWQPCHDNIRVSDGAAVQCERRVVVVSYVPHLDRCNAGHVRDLRNGMARRHLGEDQAPRSLAWTRASSARTRRLE